MSIPISQARKNIFGLVKRVNEECEPVFISSKNGDAVLLSHSDWRSIQETLYLYSVPGMKESIEEGINTPLSECKDELPW